MHIEQVTTKNFGGLANGTYNFIDGFNVIRGRNGAGKSSIFEAVLYGMFGSTALRGTIEDTVREGLNPADLRVSVKYGSYTVKRSKSSASVVGRDTKINGQSAVSDFFYDLLGIRKGSENSVLVSEQGKTAGILNGKPSEVSSLIEGLADFNQIDTLVENVKTKYPSGNANILQEMLLEVDEKVKEKEAIELTNPNIYLDKVRIGEASMSMSLKELEELLSSIRVKEKEVVEIEAGVELKKKIAEDITQEETSIKTLNTRLKEALEQSLRELLNVASEKDLVGSWPEAVDRWKLYKEVTDFSNWEGEEWEGDANSLDEELLKVGKNVKEFTKIITTAEAEIRSLKLQLNSEDNCPTCGQDTAHLHEEINKKAERGIALHESTITINTEKLLEEEDMIAVLKLIQVEQVKRKAYSRYTDNQEILPFYLKWKSKKPTEPSKEQFNKARGLIKLAEDREREIGEAKELLPKLDSEVAESSVKLESLQHEFNSTFIRDASDLKGIVAELKEIYNSDLEGYNKLEQVVKADQKEADRLTIETKFLEEAINNFKKESLELTGKLKSDSRNVEILKQVRKARPKVLNRVWSNVLNMVSVTFSDLRGEESKVEKSEKGFVINGLPVHRLSGSEKSILGISLRVALREIFAPAAGFIILDEPAADCDENRTAAVMAAVASVRGQVIMITHEELSSSSADNILDLNK